MTLQHAECSSKSTYNWSCYGWNDEDNGVDPQFTCDFREVVERTGYNAITPPPAPTPAARPAPVASSWGWTAGPSRTRPSRWRGSAGRRPTPPRSETPPP